MVVVINNVMIVNEKLFQKQCSTYKLIRVGICPTWHFKLGHFKKWSGSNYDINTLNNYHPNIHQYKIVFMLVDLEAVGS